MVRIKKIIFAKKKPVHITITCIRLKSWWHVFELIRLSVAVLEQLKNQSGFITMKRSGFGYRHYTLSAWQSEAALKSFAKMGAHQVAMSRTTAIASEVITYTYHGEVLPAWKDARKLLLQHGHVLTFKK